VPFLSVEAPDFNPGSTPSGVRKKRKHAKGFSPGSSFSLATAFRFLATRHSPLSFVFSPLLFTVDGRPSGGWPRLNSEKRLWVAYPFGFGL